jgi:RNA ligase (TIGR02306 family)
MTLTETVLEVFPLKMLSKRYDITVEGNENFFANGVLVHNCQNLAHLIFEEHKDESFEVTIKLDGSSCTIYIKDGEIGVCSRNIDLKETEGNSFWKVAREQGIIDALTRFYESSTDRCKNIALQGELVGESIQGNQEKISGQRFYLFDIFNIDEHTHLSPSQRVALKETLVEQGADLDHVPILEPTVKVTDRFGSVGDLLAYAEGPSMNPDVQREGLVFKSYESNFSFKAISNKWLLKNKDK